MKHENRFLPEDLIRIWSNNLSEDGKRDVVLFFYLVYPGLAVTSDTLKIMFDILDQANHNSFLKVVIRMAMRFMTQIRIISNSAMVSLIWGDSEMGREVRKVVKTQVERRVVRKKRLVRRSELQPERQLLLD